MVQTYLWILSHTVPVGLYTKKCSRRYNFCPLTPTFLLLFFEIVSIQTKLASEIQKFSILTRESENFRSQRSFSSPEIQIHVLCKPNKLFLLQNCISHNTFSSIDPNNSANGTYFLFSRHFSNTQSLLQTLPWHLLPILQTLLQHIIPTPNTSPALTSHSPDTSPTHNLHPRQTVPVLLLHQRGLPHQSDYCFPGPRRNPRRHCHPCLT